MMAFARGPERFAPGMHGGLGVFGPALGLLFLLAIVATVLILLVLASRRGRAMAAVHGHAPVVAHTLATDQAVQIVRERLARGEIDAEEYNRVVSALNAVFTPAASS
jgi:uncharacterized membrane protein